jgi:hypothetical protein
MNNNRPLIIVACVVLAIVGGSLWFLNSTAPVPATTTAPTNVQLPTTPTPNVPRPLPGTGTPPPIAARSTPPASANKTAATPRPLQEWELRIDEVLRSNADETQTAQILINLLPTLPAEGQEEAASHITNLVLDDQYNRVLPLVKNANLPEEVHDVFMTDLMNREDTTKLPALLEIAKIPNHPHHEEALSDLEIFLDEDFGNNWSQWDIAVKNYLKKQAEEEAATAATPPAPGAAPGNVPKK